MANDLDVRKENELVMAMDLAKKIITKNYMCELSDYEIVDPAKELLSMNIEEHMRLYRVNKLVTDKDENMLEKIMTVLYALNSENASVVTIIKGTEHGVDYYIGVVNKDSKDDLSTQGATLSSTLMGNFPGIEIEGIDDTSVKQINESIFKESCISAVSGIASIRDKNLKDVAKYVQGIENMVDALEGKEYTAIVIADPISSEGIEKIKSGYEILHSQLNPFLKSSLSFNENESLAYSHANSVGFSNSVSESTSLTQNYSNTNGWNKSESKSESTGRNVGSAVGTVLGIAVGAAAIIATGGVAAIAAGAAASTLALVGGGAAIGVGASIGGEISGNKSNSNSTSFSENGSTTKSSGKTEQYGKTYTDNTTKTETESNTESRGRALQISYENRGVKSLLDKIDKHIQRLDECESYGTFNCATYILSSDPQTNAIAASSYHSLMRGDNSSLQSANINIWNKSEETNKIKVYLSRYTHPLFSNYELQNVNVTPASVVNSKELAIAIGFPKKSLNGLPVLQSTAFGRNVMKFGKAATEESISIGKLYHMGKGTTKSVNLDVKSLAMHTFITGSTGSGKSNTVYEVLANLKDKGVKFMVVEPAKGEYKQVLATEDVHVFGSNPKLTPILRINPFRFPKSVHVLEHIDKLIEIFNVCWPMYAAMPAVLKEAVEKSYEDAGWNLDDSENRISEELYPCFEDVLVKLNEVITKSSFSQEVKDNYSGALITRVKSLTNGIYRRIFTANEIDNNVLFDDNTIIDLSRIGSIETKAMIMGILVLRLQEHRLDQGGINSKLKHVTVLEEAHNLLKRTSTEQSGEGANLLGKSVEMLANTIAEIRTYGEGFIIADQAPALLDLSVIRNTNTKIIMRLPDKDDRELVGKAANLNENQIIELAKLQTGVAAIYQNNWVEPVLCKVKEFVEPDHVVGQEPEINDIVSNDYIVKKEVADYFTHILTGDKIETDINELKERIFKTKYSSEIKCQLLKQITKGVDVNKEELAPIISKMFSNKRVLKEAEQAEDIEEWSSYIIYNMDEAVADMDRENQELITECILRQMIKEEKKPVDYLEKWTDFVKGGVR